jgi:hypothetical protein
MILKKVINMFRQHTGHIYTFFLLQKEKIIKQSDFIRLSVYLN